ncbi:uncharacterized protein LOC117791196 [Drosophila innubila]|uniref:uncharacterized protein LOC117791196 n=1 Tax=Drosophila innubila TaxID=198719 RepID=UPI00148E1F07|nr:uncharacterized protein LOC117791196 [Drosophila innubila]
MDSATVDSVYENLFSAQNFFAMHEQQQIDKQNSMMANNSLIDLDMFRYEDGGGDACGSLLLGEDYCSSFKDDALGGAASSGSSSSGNTEGNNTTNDSNNSSSTSTGIGAIETAAAATTTTTGGAATAVTTKTTSLLDWQAQPQPLDKDKNETMKSLNAFQMHSSMTDNRGAPHDCLWSSQFRQLRPPPTIQIGEEKFVLRTDTIFVLGMRLNVTKNDIIVYFGKMGHIKMDDLTLKPKIFVYKNKLTGRSKGEATITYTSPYAAQTAIYYLDGAKFLGQVLSVVPAYLSTRPGKSVRFSYAQDPVIDQQRRQRQKKWKPAIDNWVCELCRNSNFVWRLSCNRCRVSKSEAITINNASASSSAASANGGQNNWRPRKHDWTCGYCFNVNFWYRQKCNRCRAPKAELQASSESDRDKWELVVSQTSVV